MTAEREALGAGPAADTAPRPGLLGSTPSPVLVVGAIASVQFGSAIADQLFTRIGPAGAVTLRLVSASIVLIALGRPSLRGRGRRTLALAVLFGIVLAAMNLCFYEALDRIPLGIAVTLEFAGPLAVAVLGSRRRIDFVWTLLAAAGIVALAHGGTHHLSGFGIVLALAAGGFWAAYILVNARVGQAFPGATGLALAMVVAAVLALPFGVAQGGAHLIQPHSLLLGSAVGMLSSAIPYSLELEALRRIATSVFGVLMSLEPGMAALAGLIVLGQGLSTRAVIGIGLVVAASAGASRRASEAPVAV